MIFICPSKYLYRLFISLLSAKRFTEELRNSSSLILKLSSRIFKSFEFGLDSKLFKMSSAKRPSSSQRREFAETSWIKAALKSWKACSSRYFWFSAASFMLLFELFFESSLLFRLFIWVVKFSIFLRNQSSSSFEVRSSCRLSIDSFRKPCWMLWFSMVYLFIYLGLFVLICIYFYFNNK